MNYFDEKNLKTGKIFETPFRILYNINKMFRCSLLYGHKL